MSVSKKNRKFFLGNLLIAITVFIIPLIVHAKIINLFGNNYIFWKGDKVHGDFFSYYKAMWLLALALIVVIVFCLYIFMKQISLKKIPLIYIPLAVYLLFSFLSFSYSDYKDISLWGFTDRYEGFLVILAYIVLCFIASYTISSAFDLKLIFGLLLASMAIVSTIGISQFFSHDFFQTSFGKQLIAPSITNLDFKFPDKYIYSTMYNPNFVGTYFAMLVPICFSLSFLFNGLKWKLTFAALGIISLFTLIGSRSATGYVAAFAAFLFLLLFLRRQILRHWILVLVLLVSLIGASYYIDHRYDNIIANEIKSVVIGVQPSKAENSIAFSPGLLTDIDVSGNTSTLFFGNEKLTLNFESQTKQLSFEDTTGNVLQPLPSTADSNLLTFSEPNYAGVSLKIDDALINIKTRNSSFYLYITNDSGIKCVSPVGQIKDLAKPDHFGFDGYEKWGSHRGYIWSRTIPLLKDTIFLGHGPDTFAAYFPQTDLAGKLKYMNDINILVDKPHNLYLQLGLNTGIISLLAFLTFVFLYLGQCFKLYLMKPIDNNYYKFGVTCMFAVIGFCFAGLANDSVVSVSPVFWVLLGVGIACNRLYKQTIAVNRENDTPKVNAKSPKKKLLLS